MQLYMNLKYSNIKKTVLFSIALLITTTTLLSQGYYKDVFMDGGINLTSREDLPAARRLNMSIEHFVTGKGTKESPLTLQDTLIQEMLLAGSEIDHNGILLYPDGQPRFKLLYVNGGKATRHGRSLTEEGRENIQEYIKNGGNYLGTCAGMFLASTGVALSDTITPKANSFYLNVWPAFTQGTNLSKTTTGHYIEPGSPLIKYFDFDKRTHIDSVYHNGGGFAYVPEGSSSEIDVLPEGTEILLRYNYKPLVRGLSIDNKISAWAWKENKKTGRIVLTGSHPESYTSGDRLDLMSSLVLYSMEGSGKPQIKGELLKGEKRKMDKSTKDNDPDFTKIGDKQYHHFYVNIPEDAKNIKLTLMGADTYDLNLYMNQGDFAFVNNASMMDISKGAQKDINTQNITAGRWFVAVECATTVEVTDSQWGEIYTGNLSVLNGVPYTLLIDWE